MILAIERFTWHFLLLRNTDFVWHVEKLGLTMVLVLPGFVTILSHNESAIFSSSPLLGRGGSKRGMLIQLSSAIQLSVMPTFNDEIEEQMSVEFDLLPFDPSSPKNNTNPFLKREGD